MENKKNISCFVGSGILGGGIKGLICNSSKYTSGIIPFSVIAPLRFDLDEMSAESKPNNLKGIDWEFEIVCNVIFSETDFTDKYVRHYSSVDTNTLFNVDVGPASKTQIRVLLRDSTNVIFYNQTLNLLGLSLESVRVTYVNSTGIITVYQDVNVLDSRVVSYSGNFSLNRYAVGYSTASVGDELEMLLTSHYLTGVGLTNFDSNQDYSDYYISDENVVWTLSEDITGSSKYPGTGYTWPTETLIAQPQTGAMKVFDSTLNGNIPSQSFATAFDFLHKFKLENTTANGEYVLHLYCTTTSAELNITYNASTISVEIIDNAGVSQFSDTYAYTLGDESIARVLFDGTNVLLYSDGTLESTTAVSLAGGFTLDRVNVGNRQDTLNSDGYHYATRLINNGTLVEYWNLMRRVEYEGYANLLNVYGENLNLLVAETSDQFYPYEADVYLISDKNCSDNGLLLDDDSRALTDDNYNFLFED